ncbi:unnamed protein product [Rhizophagus irregularis]|nr:unnamed protein product [Rhizophagus irregularis]
MATSKIFLGGLPELINKIIQNFQNDFSTLHSCILVNRLWCRISIPLLWEDPFSIPTKNFNFIEIYLYNLSENDKKKLNEYGIIEEKDSNLNTVFNYPRYIKNLNTHKIICSVEKWNVNSSNSCSTFSQISNSTRLISKLLFKTFIESEVNLNSFEFEMTTDNDHDYFNDTVELILQNPNFINNIKNLKFSKRVANITNITKIDSFLLLLSTNCNSISTLHFKFKKRSDDIFIENFLSQNVGFGSLTSYDLKQQLFELISEYCTKIKFLKLPGFYNSQNINLAFDLIKSIGINLNYLSIHFYKFGVLDQNDEGIIKLNSLLLQELGQILPTKLEYLNLSLMIDSNDFEIFLKNSQNIFIKKLLIRNKMQIISENDILFYLEKYIMKKSRVNYLAFKEDYMKKGDLFYSKDLVKKFESYNIKIQSYDDLNINSYEYIKEMY